MCPLFTAGRLIYRAGEILFDVGEISVDIMERHSYYAALLGDISPNLNKE
jgi:hypothetical protein